MQKRILSMFVSMVPSANLTARSGIMNSVITGRVWLSGIGVGLMTGSERWEINSGDLQVVAIWLAISEPDAPVPIVITFYVLC